MGRMLAFVMLAGAAAVTAVSLPDIKRYFKMRAM
jgi:hypothetical protein